MNDIVRLLSVTSGPDVMIAVSRSDLQEFAKTLLGAETLPRQKEWLNAREVSDRFGIPYNNVKDAAWRKKNNFPCKQLGGACSKLQFHASEVSDWLSKR